MKIYWILFFGLLVGILGLSGCSRSFYGGAAVGAAGAGAAYEYQAHKAIEELDEDYKAGEITREEYERRKKEIQERSLTQ
ncbi:MAG: SHOCT domain-containing protein [Desulfuromonadales bacterium]|jgi:hypothetical protein